MTYPGSNPGGAIGVFMGEFFKIYENTYDSEFVETAKTEDLEEVLSQAKTILDDVSIWIESRIKLSELDTEMLKKKYGYKAKLTKFINEINFELSKRDRKYYENFYESAEKILDYDSFEKIVRFVKNNF